MKKGLGRGLDAIFSGNSLGFEEENGSIKKIRIGDIEPKRDQPRKYFDDESLAQLAKSIADHGVLQPILVKQVSGGFYQIIAGERRWRASKLAGLDEIPAIVVEADALKAAQIALIENIQREDLNPYEEAQAYREMLKEYGFTQEELAEQLGKSRSAIANALRLLDLPDEVVTLLRDNNLSAGHARTLLGLKNKDDILPLAQRAIEIGMSVRDLEFRVKIMNKAYEDALAAEEDDEEYQPVRVDYAKVLERKATSLTGRRVRIKDSRSKHVVQIEFEDNEDLEELLVTLCGKEIIED